MKRPSTSGSCSRASVPSHQGRAPERQPDSSIGPFPTKARPRALAVLLAYNRGKRSIVLDLESGGREASLRGARRKRRRAASRARSRDYSPRWDLLARELLRRYPRDRRADDAFGDDGPWAEYKASDLVHLALGGQMMNCGYDPRPDGTTTCRRSRRRCGTPTTSPASSWRSGSLAALDPPRGRGSGQNLSCAIHEAAREEHRDRSDELGHARASLIARPATTPPSKRLPIPPIVHTKDGRWFMRPCPRRRCQQARRVPGAATAWPTVPRAARRRRRRRGATDPRQLPRCPRTSASRSSSCNA